MIDGWRGEHEHAGWNKIVASIGKLVGRPGLPGLLAVRSVNQCPELLHWAQKFPDDQSAEEVFASVADRERRQFNAELESQRAAIASQFKSIEVTKEAIFSDCAKAFEYWIGDLRHADYKKRPRPEQALLASTPNNPLDIDALRNVVLERDAAVARATNLATELASVRLVAETPKKAGLHWYGALLIAVISGGAAGLGIDRSQSNRGVETQYASLANTLDEAKEGWRRTEEILKQSQSDLASTKKELLETQTHLRSATERADAAEERANSASAQLRGIISTSTTNVGALQTQLTQKSNEIDSLRRQYEGLRGQLAGKDADIDRLREAITTAQATRSVRTRDKEDSAEISSLGSQTIKVESITKCSLVIQGDRLIDASPCVYGNGSDGEAKLFSITSPSNDPRRYKVTWRVSDNMGVKTAEAVLEGGKSMKPRTLGKLYRDSKSKACWVSPDESVRICANR